MVSQKLPVLVVSIFGDVGSVFLVLEPFLPHPAELLQVKALASSFSVVLITLLFQCCAIMAFMLSIIFKTSSSG